MEYLFVFKDGGWWLKVENEDQLFDYYENSNKKWMKSYETLLHSKEFTKNGNVHADNIGYAIGLYGSNRKLDALTSIVCFRQQIINDQIDCLLKYGSIYINQSGGYHYEEERIKHNNYVRKKKLIFPNYSRNDIKVERFPGGIHFYAYVGETQVRDGDILKWNTYEEAMKEAEKLIQLSD